MPCDWLEWRQHKDGFVYAWLAGTEPGDMAADLDWTPERSRTMQRGDITTEPGRALRLADEDGIETWLDLKTALQHRGLAIRGEGQTDGVRTGETQTGEGSAPIKKIRLFQRDRSHPKPPPQDMSSTDDTLPSDEYLEKFGMTEEELDKDITEFMRQQKPLLRQIETALSEEGHDFEVKHDGVVITLAFGGPHTSYQTFFLIDEDKELIRFYVRPPFRVLPERRLAVAEALTRANYNLPIGNFELDFSDGEVRFKVAIDVEGGKLGSTMIHNMMSAGLTFSDRYYPAIMRVTYADISPEDAIREVEE
jgi:hypothetical protein